VAGDDRRARIRGDPDGRLRAADRSGQLIADTVWPGGVNIAALGADHLFARWRDHAYVLAMLGALDVAIRDLPRPDPTATASESLTIRSR